MGFSLTDKQKQARKLLGGPATHVLLFGGSRSGKTFLIIRMIIIRALAAPGSRHAILRFRFNHVKTAVIHDTFPKVMELCFSGVDYKLDKTDWFAEFDNGSQIWFGGLDDKERTEKILGQEHVTIYLNEASQIPDSSRNLAKTRLAQSVTHRVGGEEKRLRLKMFYDCNPPSQAHWSYQLFVKKRDPETKAPLKHPENFAFMVLNPADNLENLPPGYMEELEDLPARLRVRFLKGEYSPIAEGALWTLEDIEKYRKLDELPDMQRIVVAVDPSGSGDDDNIANDAIGIIVGGLGVDGNGYVLEDLTVKAGPTVWGRVATQAYERHSADRVVAEQNFGGEMVKSVIQTARRNTPYKKVTASRGKVVRAEPISALAEKGRIRHAGNFPDLEDELCAFTTHGYMGTDSPNRADAYVWAFTELFGGIVAGPKKKFISHVQVPSSPYSL
jgi:predicted phage terminase large subunit-like protein